MKPDNASHQEPPRPEFMMVLGLLPPYTEADVHKAYFEKAKQAHPDHGGDSGEFHQLHEAFESAMHYVEHRTDKHSWIASQVKKYMMQELAVERLRKLGAEIETNVIDWLWKSFGDFAELTEKVITIRLADSARGDAVLEILAENAKTFHSLKRLELPRCEVSDSGAAHLAGRDQLQQLDLSGNPISSASLNLLRELPAIKEVIVSDTKIGWLGRWRLRSLSVKQLS